MKTKIAAAFLALALLSGCAGPLHPRELQELQPVQTLGFDAAPEDVIVSASDPGDGEGGAPVRLTAAGPGAAAAVEALGAAAAREELFYAHVRFVVLGESAAKRGIGEILDWFERSTQTRLGLPLFVVKGTDARTLVTAPGETDREISALLAALERQSALRGDVYCFTLLDTARSLSRTGAALCCAVAPAEDLPSAGEEAPVLKTAGYAVLKDGALRGWLGEGASRGATLLLNRAGEMSYELRGVTVTLRRAKAALRPGTDRDGRPRLAVELTARAGVTGMAEPRDLTPALRRELEDALSEALLADAAAALAASREMEADFLDLAALFPPGSGFSLRDMDWEIAVRSELERSYDIDGGPALRGEGAAA